MIYEIKCNITNEKYIGSTKQKIKKRLYSHICKSNTCSSKQIIERGDWTFKILEELENYTKEELLLLEKKYINENECINKFSPLRTKEELKEWNVKYKKEYYSKNKNELIEKSKEWYKNNKDEKIINQRNYYNLNKDNINTKKKEIIMCNCGKNYTYTNKLRHFSSKFHINNITI
jgi:hypothetical protein